MRISTVRHNLSLCDSFLRVALGEGSDLHHWSLGMPNPLGFYILLALPCTLRVSKEGYRDY
jgi:hypothetical protein